MSTGLDGHALVIGVDAYSGGIPPLQSAKNDASAIARLLQADHDYQVSRLLDDAATHEAIETFLASTLPARLSDDSAFMLYFAGHGVALGNGSEGPRGFFLPYDSEMGNEDSWFSMDCLRSLLEKLPCRHLLVVLDCCFAGSFRWASSREVYFDSGCLYDSQYERYVKGDAWQALTSASHDERAADLAPTRNEPTNTANGSGHSPFAAALLKGLAGDADSSRAGYEPDGVITATELYQYIFEELMPVGAELSQTPGIWPLRSDNTGEYIFLSPASTRNTLPDPPLDDGNNPWLGLSTYSENEHSIFYGRQRVIDDLLERLLAKTHTPLVTVVGASGTGKSSVVKAGVLPLLQNPPADQIERVGCWHIVHCQRLHRNPNQQLQVALTELHSAANPGRQLLLIDQFEELYTLCPDDALRTEFLTALRAELDSNARLTVLLTLRSDFEPRPSKSAALNDVWAMARFVVPSFSSEEFRDVIEGPAAAKALYFEPTALVGELMDEVMAMPGALPLLSFSLAEMYRQAQLRRRGTGGTDRSITTADYEAAGGVIGALHKRASAIFEQASSEPHRNTIRKLFLRMTTSDGAGYTRRRVSEAELEFPDPEENERIRRVVGEYIEGRLLVKDGRYVEPAHDTLVVAWDKLQDWLSSSGSQQLARSLWSAAREWNDNKHDKSSVGLLWHDDPRLPQAQTLRSELNSIEQAFVDASAKRKKRRRNQLIGSVAATMAVLAASSLLAWNQKLEADKSAAHATDRSLFMQAADTDSTLTATLLISEIDNIRSIPEAVGSLSDISANLDVGGIPIITIEHPAIASHPRLLNFAGHPYFSANGETVIVPTNNGVMQWHVKTGGLLHHIKGTENIVLPGAVSNDGTLALVHGENNSLILHTLLGDASPTTLPGHRGTIEYAGFTADGQNVLAVSANEATLWNTEGQVVSVTIWRGTRFRSAATSATGARFFIHKEPANIAHVATSSGLSISTNRRGVRITRLDEGKYRGNDSRYGFQSYTNILSVSGDTTQQLTWDASNNTARKPDVYLKPSTSGEFVAHKEDSRWLISRADTAADVGNIECLDERSHLLDFGVVDGREIYAICKSGDSLWLTDVNNTEIRIQHYAQHPSAHFDRRGKKFLIKDINDVLVFDSVAASGKAVDGVLAPVASLQHDTAVHFAAFDPQGDRVITSSEKIRIWEYGSRHRQTVFSTHSNSVNAVDFSHDGELVASSAGNEVFISTSSNGALIRKETFDSSIRSIEFSPSERTLLLTTDEHLAWLISLDDTQRLIPLLEEKQIQSAMFDRDGSTLLLRTSDGLFRWQISTSDYAVETLPLKENEALTAMYNGLFLIRSDYSNIAVLDDQGNRLTPALRLFRSADWTANGLRVVHLEPGDPRPRLKTRDTTVIVSYHENIDGPIDPVFTRQGDRFLVRGRHDQQLFDSASGKQLAWLPGSDDVTASSFSPNDNRIAAGYADGSVKTHAFSAEFRQAILRAQTRECLDEQVRIQALGNSDELAFIANTDAETLGEFLEQRRQSCRICVNAYFTDLGDSPEFLPATYLEPFRKYKRCMQDS
ncbi:MAG: caspase family protein [Pseudomonadota bacterium]